MAQIIRHRKGVLESVNSATKRKAELLIVTGSSGITATNSDAMVFFGDGTDATPANKIIYGTSTPDLTGASYSTAVDGIPYYNTSEEKLYILAKGGNTEVKATANTGGTNILSGSANAAGNLTTAISDLGANIYSGSVQVAADLLSDNRNIDLGTGTFDAGTITSDGTLNVSGISNLGVISGSSMDLTGNANIQGNITLGGNITIGDASSDTIAFGGDLSTDIIPNANNTLDLGSSTDKFAEVHATVVNGTTFKAASGNVVSGSSQVFSDIAGGDVTIASNGVASITADSIINADIKTDAAIAVSKLNLEGSGIISGSTQLDGTALGTTSDIEASGSFTGSFVGDGSGLTGLATNLDVNGEDIDLITDDLDIVGTTNEITIGTAKVGTDVTVTVGLPDDVVIGDSLTVTGDLTVNGTQTIVNSTTVQLDDNVIELNGSGVANGGLLVKDATAPNTASGSLLWDSTNDYWKGGAAGSESKILLAGGDSVVSGSSQVTTGAASGEVLLKNASDDTIDGSAIFSDGTDLISIGTATGNVGDLGSGNQLSLYGASTTSGLLSFDVGGTSKSFDYVSGDVRYVDTNSGVSVAIKPDATATKAWIFDTDGDLVSNGGSWASGDIYASNLNARNHIVALGDISGSNMLLTGNATIEGNIVLGGNIQIGDNATDDTVTFGGEVASDIIPNADNSRDLGSASDRFAEIHGTNIYGAINATNGVVSGSGQLTDMTGDVTVDSSGVSSITADSIINADIKSDAAIAYTKLNLESSGIISGSAQLLNVATDFGTGRVSGEDIGDLAGTSTFTGSFVGDGSGLTGLSTDLGIADALGNSNAVDLINDTLTFNSGSGATGIEVTVGTDTVSVTGVDATTSAKGVASFDSDDFTLSSGNVSLKSGDGSLTSGGVRGANLNDDTAGDGLTYSLSNQQLDVSYGSIANTAVEGNTTATFTGTANEITVSDNSAQAIGSGIAVTIGLPDDVTIADTLTVNGNVQLGNATSDTVTIAGNLQVEGTTTTVDSTTVQIGDNILELNGTGATNAGLLVKDATAPNTISGSLLWDSTNDYWMGGAAGSEKEFARLNAAPTSNTVQKADSNGLLVDSVLTDDGTDATFSGDLIIDGLSVGSNGGFLYVDTSNQLNSATATTAGDVIQWDGSSFVASNELDGGTF
jgi:hypothetical protein